MSRIGYHYTSVDALLSMIEKRELHFTNVRFFLDRDEVERTRRIAHERIDRLVPRDRDDTFFDSPDGWWLGEMKSEWQNTDGYAMTSGAIFAMSFCRSPDKYLMWSNYADRTNGRGCLLAFHLDRLPDLLKRDNPDGVEVNIVDCEYLDDDQLRSSIDTAVEDSRKYWEERKKTENPQPSMVAAAFWDRMLRPMEVAFKGRDFEWEDEVRVVVSAQAKHRRYKIRRTLVQPYIALNIKRLPIEQIILAPGTDPNLVGMVQAVMTAEGYEITVRPSKVTGWV